MIFWSQGKRRKKGGKGRNGFASTTAQGEAPARIGRRTSPCEQDRRALVAIGHPLQDSVLSGFSFPWSHIRKQRHTNTHTNTHWNTIHAMHLVWWNAHMTCRTNHALILTYVSSRFFFLFLPASVSHGPSLCNTKSQHSLYWLRS